jgi:hypothetical protein
MPDILRRILIYWSGMEPEEKEKVKGKPIANYVN